MKKTLKEYEQEFEKALEPLDTATALRVKSDQVVGHEYFDDDNPRHLALRLAVDAARELKRAKIREVA